MRLLALVAAQVDTVHKDRFVVLDKFKIGYFLNLSRTAALAASI